MRSCPWCSEPLPRARGDLCPSCGRPLVDVSREELRPVDVRYDRVEAAQCETYRVILLAGGAAVAAISLLMPLLHVTVVVAVPLLTVAHLVLVRLVLVRDACRLLGPSRRRFVRWLSRLSFLWLGIPGYGLTTIPVLGVVAGVGIFVGLTAAIHHYVLWSLGREHRRQPLMVWERLLVLGLIVLTLLATVVLAVAVIAVGWSASALVGWLQPE